MRETLKLTKKGWVIINENHPNGLEKQVFEHTFSGTRKKCIETFIKDSMQDWDYWRVKYGYRAVKAEKTIQVSVSKPTNQ